MYSSQKRIAYYEEIFNLSLFLTFELKILDNPIYQFGWMVCSPCIVCLLHGMTEIGVRRLVGPRLELTKCVSCDKTTMFSKINAQKY